MNVTRAMRDALRRIGKDRWFKRNEIAKNTFDGLRRRGLIEVVEPTSMSVCYWRLTPAGRYVLEEQT